MSTASILYQQYIEQHVETLPVAEQLQLADLIKHKALRRKIEQSVEDSRQTDIMDLHGLGRELWQGVDVQAYIDSLRNEWR